MPYIADQWQHSEAAQPSESHLSEQAWNAMRAECKPSNFHSSYNQTVFSLRNSLLGMAVGSRFGARGAAVGLGLGLITGLTDGRRTTAADEFKCINQHLQSK